MFEALRSIFTRPEAVSAGMSPRLAVAALLVHLAAVDGTITPEERTALAGALEEHYGLTPAEVDRLVAEATKREAEAVDFYRFTSAIATLEAEEKLQIVRMMWQVVFADRKNHELEDNVVWRVAELIGVSTRDRNVLRNQMARG